MRHKLQGLFLARSIVIYNLGTQLPERLCCPSTQIWERTNAASLWPFPKTAALNPVLMVPKYSPNSQPCKLHLPSKKNPGGKHRRKFKRRQPSKKTISKGMLYSHSFLSFLNRKEKSMDRWWILGVFKTCKPKLQKPINSQQSERPLAKMRQTINAEGTVEKCVPSVLRWTW